jgi:hypothetical protein
MMNIPVIIYFLFHILIIPSQDEIPFKSAHEFEFELNLEFRPKPSLDEEVELGNIMYKMKSDNASIIAANKQTYDPATLPYASLMIRPTKLSSGEDRVRVVDNLNNRLYNRKTSLDVAIEFEMGYTDDLKDHISPYQFEVIFYSKRKEASRILVYFDKDGNLIINEEVRGKF